MKLIVLYGPPAAGKYTIAKAISEKTGYKLFHNHLTVDLLASIFTFGTPEFVRLNQKIRLDIFEQAAKKNISGIIFTYVYEKNISDEFVKSILEKITSSGGEVIFIQIYCEKEELLKRVKGESREKFHKIKSEENLLETLSKRDQMSQINFVDGVTIDSTHLTIEATILKVFDTLKKYSF